MKELTITYPDNLSDSIINWFKINNITPEKLYCRECGNLLITEDLSNVDYVGRIDSRDYPVFKRCNNLKSTLKNKYERISFKGDVNSQWLLRGRIINSKLFFRHTCWSCFINNIFKTVDVAKKAKKSTYYRKLLNNHEQVPDPSWAVNKTFKYLFDISDEDLAQEHIKYDTASKESWIRRHGADGENLYEKYCKRQGYTASTEYLVKEKGYSENEALDFHANRAATHKNFVKRYGKEIGTKKWISYCNRQAYAGNKLEYFIEKYGAIVGKAKYKDVCQQKALTLNTFIRKYGEIEGRTHWLAYCNKLKIGYSKVSSELFLLLLLAMPKEKQYICKFAEYGKETIININNKTYYIDFTYNNKAIEFFGDYWHANPDVYNADVVMPFVHKTAETIWQQDKQRIADLTSIGYEVLVIWESEFRTNPDDTINKCLTFLDI